MLPDLLPLKPYLREAIWGGRGLETHFDKTLPPNAQIGESWEEMQPHLEELKTLLAELGLIDFKAILLAVVKILGVAFVGALRIVKGVIMGLAAAFDNVVGVLTGVWRFFQSGIQMIVALFQGDLPLAREKAEEVLGAIATIFTETIQGIIDLIIGFLEGAFPGLVDAIKDFVDTGLEGWKKAWENLQLAFETVRDIIQEAVDKRIQKWKDAWDGFWESIDNLRELLAVTLLDAWNTVTGALSDAIDTVLTPLREAWDKITGAVQSLLDLIPKIKFPDIKIPNPFKGESPPPLATWFTQIKDAMEDLNAINLQGGFSAQLGELTRQLAVAPATTGLSRNYQFYEGAFANAFPNVATAGDGEDLVRRLQKLADDADLKRR